MTENSSPTQGHLIAWIVIFIYALFTIFLNNGSGSHSLSAIWPWVLLWQTCYIGGIIWFLGRLWLLRRLTPLGKGWDIWTLIVLVGVIISTIFAQFSSQAIWQAIPVVGWLATLYVLNQTLTTPESRFRLLVFQGGLSIAFIVVGLFAWLKDTFFPELSRLATIKEKLGLDLHYDFSILELRNWAPLGHQNYVGGYLVLAIPLLVGLSILQKGVKRWIWVTGSILGLIHLYTTSSKAAWLALFILSLITVIFLFSQSSISRKALTFGSLGVLTILSIFIISNNRLRDILGAILSGKGGAQELTYRLITADMGHRMAISRPLTGVGVGGVPILFQKYHPVSAGAQSEHIYQLHSTLTQLWAELGIWGVLIFFASFGLLVYGFIKRSKYGTDSLLYLCLFGGLFAYFIVSLTDYQIDNLPINGMLLIFLACLTSARGEKEITKTYPLPVFYTGLGILAAVVIWSFPVHQAWLLSSQGFQALDREDVTTFVASLTRSSQLTPWEPYYPYQLGWNLGDMAIKTPDFKARTPLLTEAIRWFQVGVEKSPYLEFGHSNLAWLLLQANPKLATESFIKAIEILPAKKGNAYGLGISFLLQNKPKLAVKALTLECLRNPVFITSRSWNSVSLRPLYPQVIGELIKQYNQLLEKYPQAGALNTHLHQVRGGIYWWIGNFTAAKTDFQVSGDLLSQLLVKASLGGNIQTELDSITPPKAQFTIKAWYDPKERMNLLEKAWVLADEGLFSEDIQKQFIASFTDVTTLEQWIKQKAPILSYRNQRPNFGVNSLHIDGPLPIDFYPVVDNGIMTRLLDTILPSTVYFPEFDLAIQPIREDWLKTLQ